MFKVSQLPFNALFAAVLMLALTACGDSSSSRDVSTTTIDGQVVDGYVESAQVQLFDGDSLDFSTPVASGTTDSEGRFSFQLPDAQVPERPFFRTMGGYSVDTGLPAPSMSLQPDPEATQYTVTPITDLMVRQRYQARNGFSGPEGRIAEKLKEEASGILAWMVRGCLEWQNKGLAPPQEVLASSWFSGPENMTGDIDEFLEECCSHDPHQDCGADRMYNRYKAWADSKNLRALSQQDFSKEMRTHFRKRKKSQGMVYEGVRID